MHGVVTNQLEKARRAKNSVVEARLLLARDVVTEWKNGCENEHKYVEHAKASKERGRPPDEDAILRVLPPSRSQMVVLRAAVKVGTPPFHALDALLCGIHCSLRVAAGVGLCWCLGGVFLCHLTPPPFSPSSHRASSTQTRN